MYVVSRLDRGSDFFRRFGENLVAFISPKAMRREHVFRRPRAKRTFAHADNGQSRMFADAIAHRQGGGRSGHGKIAEAAGKFRKAGTGPAGGRG